MTLGVYIQIPFCQTKCTYCNFHTGVVPRDRYQPYADALCREIRESAAHGAQPVDTVYFGGGTPSLLDPAALARILDALRAAHAVESPEITLEADPETVTAEKASAWERMGINRISLGVQSFHDAELRSTGRLHRREDIFRATDLLRTAGLRNISMDLIAGLPHQTAKTWEESLNQLLRLYPEHVSIYMLELDEGSRLGRESLAGGTRYSVGAIPDDDAIAGFYESARVALAKAGYDHYEISNWGLPGFPSRHNLKYWHREPYYGAGAGAHSFDGIVRWANVHEASRYVTLIQQGGSVHELTETVTPLNALSEMFFLGLRLLAGVDLAWIERQCQADEILRGRWEVLRQRVDTLQRHGMIELAGDRLRIPPDRLTISNEIFLELLG